MFYYNKHEYRILDYFLPLLIDLDNLSFLKGMWISENKPVVGGHTNCQNDSGSHSSSNNFWSVPSLVLVRGSKLASNQTELHILRL